MFTSLCTRDNLMHVLNLCFCYNVSNFLTSTDLTVTVSVNLKILKLILKCCQAIISDILHVYCCSVKTEKLLKAIWSGRSSDHLATVICRTDYIWFKNWFKYTNRFDVSYLLTSFIYVQLKIFWQVCNWKWN